MFSTWSIDFVGDQLRFHSQRINLPLYSQQHSPTIGAHLPTHTHTHTHIHTHTHTHTHNMHGHSYYVHKYTQIHQFYHAYKL